MAAKITTNESKRLKQFSFLFVYNGEFLKSLKALDIIEKVIFLSGSLF